MRLAIVRTYPTAAGRRARRRYQCSWREATLQLRHVVHRHWCWQPGQRPRVSNVFHTVPQASKGGSGVSSQAQHHRLPTTGASRTQGTECRRPRSRGLLIRRADDDRRGSPRPLFARTGSAMGPTVQGGRDSGACWAVRIWRLPATKQNRWRMTGNRGTSCSRRPRPAAVRRSRSETGQSLRTRPRQAPGPPSGDSRRALAQPRRLRGALLAQHLGVSRRAQHGHLRGVAAQGEGSHARRPRGSPGVLAGGPPAIARSINETTCDMSVEPDLQAQTSRTST